MMKEYKAVFIDWDDTIGDWNTSAEKAQRVLYEQNGWASFEPDFARWLAVYKAHNTYLWEEYAKGTISREYLHIDQFLHPICAYKQIAPTEVTDALREACNALGDAYIRLTNAYFTLKPHAAEIVRYLAARYPLTIVSNGYVETQYLKLEKSGLKEYFTHTVFSEEVGYAKPDARIMEEALRRNREQMAGLRKEEVIMIGDSYTSDIAGAKAAGIDSIWWLPDAEGVQEQQRKDATYIVTDLLDIQAIL